MATSTGSGLPKAQPAFAHSRTRSHKDGLLRPEALREHVPGSTPCSPSCSFSVMCCPLPTPESVSCQAPRARLPRGCVSRLVDSRLRNCMAVCGGTDGEAGLVSHPHASSLGHETEEYGSRRDSPALDPWRRHLGRGREGRWGRGGRALPAAVLQVSLLPGSLLPGAGRRQSPTPLPFPRPRLRARLLGRQTSMSFT